MSVALCMLVIVWQTIARTTQECYEGDGTTYNGTYDATGTGFTCKEWSSVWISFYPNVLREGEPYCRNPTGGSYTKPWCITADGAMFCSIQLCGWEGECYHDNGVSYIGKYATTVTGTKCRNWPDVNFTLLTQYERHGAEHNYCRNPFGQYEKPWCYDEFGNPNFCNLDRCAEPLNLTTSHTTEQTHITEAKTSEITSATEETFSFSFSVSAIFEVTDYPNNSTLVSSSVFVLAVVYILNHVVTSYSN